MSRQLNRLEALNRQLENAVEQLRENHAGLSGVAVGYAYDDEKNSDIHAVIKEADEMMYQKKNETRK